MKSRFSLVLFVAVALVLASPLPAAAHGGDALHQHGFSDLYYLYQPAFRGTGLRCMSTIPWFDGTVQPGTVEHFMPDRVTSPIYQANTSARVFLAAQLETYDFQNRAVVAKSPWSNYAYTFANQTGRTNGYWFDWNSASGTSLGRVLDMRFSWPVYSGWYRVHLYYFWGADGYEHHEWTEWCQVS